MLVILAHIIWLKDYDMICLVIECIDSSYMILNHDKCHLMISDHKFETV